MSDIRVGDEVLVKGTVLEVRPGVGVRVELFSKTDQYWNWVREDRVELAPLPDASDEPEDGTWLVAWPLLVEVSAFRRDDDQAPADVDRRFRRRWFDVRHFEWIDWPTAKRRGADRSRVLLEVPND